MAAGKKMKQKLFKQSLRPPKQYQKRGNKLISSDLSSKILKEALEQQKEEILLREATEGGGAFIDSFDAAVSIDDGEEEDIDGFQGFSETNESQYHAGAEQDIDEEDERILEVFMPKEAAGPQQLTLADLIIQKIKDTTEAANTEVQQLPQLDNTIIDLYKGVGKLLSRYTEGKTPKAFKHIPSLELWEEALYLTEPENWSPNAMYQATRIFSSKRVEKAQRFYNLVLLPRIRDDIRKHNKLHFSLYQSLKKSLYKPAAFFKGILLPLCQSGTCTLREAVIIGSIIQKYSIPKKLSSAALIKMAEMEYCGTTSYFIKLFLDKKYALHLEALDAAVAHFMKFLDDSRIMPVIWHHSLLALVQRYKNGLTKEVKDNLDRLIQYQKHHLVTPEIRRELKNSCNRGENEEDLMSIYILV